MIILDATTKSLQLKLGAAVTTNQLPFAASYVDSTGTTTTPGELDGASNGTTAVNVVSAPAASTQRLIKNIVIQNADTVSAKVTVIYNNNSTLRNILIATLAVGDQLIYEDGNGWQTIDTNGNLKTSASGGGGGAVTSVSNSDGTLTISPTTGNVVASLAHGVGIGYNAIAGLLPSSISGTNTTAALTVSTGQATDSTNAVAMALSSSASWAVSNGNAINGYQGGTTLPNSSTIHFFVCTGTSGTGVFASTSLSPTLPSGYNTYYRRIFSLNTNASGAFLPGTAIGINGGGMLYYFTTQITDISTSSLGYTARTLYALTVPTGIKVQPIGRFSLATSGSAILFTSGDETDVAVTGSGDDMFTGYPGFDLGYPGSFVAGGFNSFLTTNTSGQIGARSATASTTFYWITRGFIDFRQS